LPASLGKHKNALGKPRALWVVFLYLKEEINDSDPFDFNDSDPFDFTLISTKNTTSESFATC